MKRDDIMLFGSATRVPPVARLVGGTRLAAARIMKIWELMTQDAVTCRSSDTLQDAAQLMWDRDLGALPIIDEHGRVAGMITDRDICMAACTRGEPLTSMVVASAMSAPVATCSRDDDLTAVEAQMSERQLHRVPVVDDDGRLLGIVTLNDFARTMRLRTEISPLGIASTLAAVAAPRPLLVAADGPRAATITPAIAAGRDAR